MNLNGFTLALEFRANTTQGLDVEKRTRLISRLSRARGDLSPKKSAPCVVQGAARDARHEFHRRTSWRAGVAALKQFVVLFIAASYTPGPNFVERDKIIFRTGGQAGAPASQPASHIAQRTYLVGFSSYAPPIWRRQIKPEFMRESS